MIKHDNGETTSWSRMFGSGVAVNNTVDVAVEEAVEAAPDDDKLILAKHKIERLEKEVSARDNRIQTIKAGVQERVPSDYQPTTGIKPQAPAKAPDPVTEDAPPVASDDFAGLSEAQLMSMSFD
jgi:hypothetical protein